MKLDAEEPSDKREWTDEPFQLYDPICNLPAARFKQTVPNLQWSHPKICYPDIILFIQQ